METFAISRLVCNRVTNVVWWTVTDVENTSLSLSVSVSLSVSLFLSLISPSLSISSLAVDPTHDRGRNGVLQELATYDQVGSPSGCITLKHSSMKEPQSCCSVSCCVLLFLRQCRVVFCSFGVHCRVVLCRE